MSYDDPLGGSQVPNYQTSIPAPSGTFFQLPIPATPSGTYFQTPQAQAPAVALQQAQTNWYDLMSQLLGFTPTMTGAGVGAGASANTTNPLGQQFQTAQPVVKTIPMQTQLPGMPTSLVNPPLSQQPQPPQIGNPPLSQPIIKTAQQTAYRNLQQPNYQFPKVQPNFGAPRQLPGSTSAVAPRNMLADTSNQGVQGQPMVNPMGSPKTYVSAGKPMSLDDELAAATEAAKKKAGGGGGGGNSTSHSTSTSTRTSTSNYSTTTKNTSKSRNKQRPDWFIGLLNWRI
jgi:hypothetical protein